MTTGADQLTYTTTATSLSLVCPATSNDGIPVSGALTITGTETGIGGATIVISYTLQETSSPTYQTVMTNSSGDYSALLTPSAAGTYTIGASFAATVNTPRRSRLVHHHRRRVTPSADRRQRASRRITYSVLATYPGDLQGRCREELHERPVLIVRAPPSPGRCRRPASGRRANTSFRAATRTPARLNERPASRGIRDCAVARRRDGRPEPSGARFSRMRVLLSRGRCICCWVSRSGTGTPSVPCASSARCCSARGRWLPRRRPAGAAQTHDGCSEAPRAAALGRGLGGSLARTKGPPGCESGHRGRMLARSS